MDRGGGPPHSQGPVWKGAASLVRERLGVHWVLSRGLIFVSAYGPLLFLDFPLTFSLKLFS